MTIRNYTAGAAIAKYRIVKFSADGTVIQGVLATDALIGVVDIPNNAPTGARVDVVRDDITLVELGGTVVAGDLLTSDAVGRAVKAVPAAGANNRIVGIAETAGVLGDITYMQIDLSAMQG